MIADDVSSSPAQSIYFHVIPIGVGTRRATSKILFQCQVPPPNFPFRRGFPREGHVSDE